MKQYLKNFDKNIALEVLKEFETTDSILVIVLGIYPKNKRTGMLEERRAWLRRFWDQIFEEIGSDKMGGCTALWTEIFFVASCENQELILNSFQSILKSMIVSEFKSLCMFGKVNKDTNKQIKTLDFMVHHLGSDDDFSRDAPGMIRMIDGEII